MRNANNRVNNNAANNSSKSLTLAAAFARVIWALDMDYLDSDEKTKVTYISAGDAAKESGHPSSYTMAAGTAIAKICGCTKGNEAWNKTKSRYEIPADKWNTAEKAWVKAGSKAYKPASDEKPADKPSSRGNKAAIAAAKKKMEETAAAAKSAQAAATRAAKEAKAAAAAYKKLTAARH